MRTDSTAPPASNPGYTSSYYRSLYSLQMYYGLAANTPTAEVRRVERFLRCICSWSKRFSLAQLEDRKKLFCQRLLEHLVEMLTR